MNKNLLFTLLIMVGLSYGLFAYFSTQDTNDVDAHASSFAWETDFEAAQAKAKATGKPMLLDFTGSDWCGWCIRLKKEVFSQAEFIDYAASAFVLVTVDFPRGKPQSEALQQQNDALAKKYGVSGFPTIILLSPDGALLAETGYLRGGAENYVAHLKELLENN
ncbi:MAG: Disulfide bond reductase DsbH [Opitutia bacterium UBA7350]|nr:MAG: Disulfide bond reductase DsbH [Opitutae bacterium UBA7350]